MRVLPAVLVSAVMACFIFPSCLKKSDERVAPVSMPEMSVSAPMPIASTDGTDATCAVVESLACPTSLDDKFSYVYGYQVAHTLFQTYSLDGSYIARGVLDATADKGTAFFTSEEMKAIMDEYISTLQEENDAKMTKLATENLASAESFMAANKTRSGVVSVSDKLQYEILKPSTADGKTSIAEDTVNVNYRLTLLSGAVVDSSYDRGSPSALQLSHTIPGFSQIVCLMKEGEKVRAWIHPSLGYGETGSSSIAPNELLIFDIELLSIEKK